MELGVEIVTNAVLCVIIQKIGSQRDGGILHDNMLSDFCQLGIAVIYHVIAPKVQGVVLDSMNVSECFYVIAVGVLVKAVAGHHHVVLGQFYVPDQFVPFQCRFRFIEIGVLYFYDSLFLGSGHSEYTRQADEKEKGFSCQDTDDFGFNDRSVPYFKNSRISSSTLICSASAL